MGKNRVLDYRRTDFTPVIGLVRYAFRNGHLDSGTNSIRDSIKSSAKYTIRSMGLIFYNSLLATGVWFGLEALLK